MEERTTNDISSRNPSDYDFPSDGDAETSQRDEAIKRTPGGRNKTIDVVVATDASDEVSTPGNRKGKGENIETPSRTRGTPVGETPRWRRNDRSARKKSARVLIEKVVAGDASDDEEEGQDIAREIYESSEEEEEEEEDSEAEAEAQDGKGAEERLEAATPSKTPRGRKKKSTTETTTTRNKRKKSPTPPRDLPPHEQYFAQNRPGAAKTSGNTLAALQLLTHEEYFSVLRRYKDPHAEDIEFLQSVHAESFPQWAFELSQGFSVCLYGYGSKRRLLGRFARYLYDASPDHISHKIVVVNGYVRTVSLREILGTVAGAVDRSHRLPAGGPSAMLDSLRALLSSPAHAGKTITVILNSVDAAPLRRPATQAALAQLVAAGQWGGRGARGARVRLACSADTPDFALLWDGAARSAFAFAFHDCTTLAPLAPAEADVVDDVHELLGRRARRVGGREGVAYVLRSLPENARSLFRLLVGEVLAAAADVDDGHAGGRGGGGEEENPGIEYRMLYNKAVEEFICSSEMAFRTLLKE